MRYTCARSKLPVKITAETEGAYSRLSNMENTHIRMVTSIDVRLVPDKWNQKGKKAPTNRSCQCVRMTYCLWTLSFQHEVVVMETRCTLRFTRQSRSRPEDMQWPRTSGTKWTDRPFLGMISIPGCWGMCWLVSILAIPLRNWTHIQCRKPTENEGSDMDNARIIVKWTRRREIRKYTDAVGCRHLEFPKRNVRW